MGEEPEFVSGYNTLHYSTISRFLIKYADQIIDLESKIIHLADERGYLDYNLIAIDGTIIRAKASEKFIGTFDNLLKRIEKLKVKITNAVEKQKQEVNENHKKYWKKMTLGGFGRECPFFLLSFMMNLFL